jgi:IS30 family transposase
MKHLKLEQRYAIKAYLNSGMSSEFIASKLGVHECSIRRELKRNPTKNGGYNPDFAQKLANERKERFAINRRFDENMARIINEKIKQEQWSPEQIKGHCNKHGIPMVSIERIYQYVREDKTNGGNLYKDLRHKLKHRKRPAHDKQQAIKDRVSIGERPDIINNKERFGDWEIDLIVGKENKGAMVVIVERKTAMFFIRKLEHGKNAEKLAEVVIDMLLPYKEHVKSITSDNGSEFAKHKQIVKKIEASFFFAHPYASWERGLSEYTNKLIRQYIPKKSNFKEFDNEYVKQVQYKINRRPRKNLNFENPMKVFYKFVA